MATGEADGRLHLEWLPHVCKGRWQRTTRPERTSRGLEVTYGTLADGRWYAEVVRDAGDEARPYLDRESAQAVARTWMDQIGGEWEQVMCYPTHGWQDGEQGQPPGSAGGS